MEKRRGFLPAVWFVLGDVIPAGFSLDLVGSALMFKVLAKAAESQDRIFNANDVDFDVSARLKEDGKKDVHAVRLVDGANLPRRMISARLFSCGRTIVLQALI
jgi:hypothetical protein